VREGHLGSGCLRGLASFAGGSAVQDGCAYAQSQTWNYAAVSESAGLCCSVLEYCLLVLSGKLSAFSG